MLGLPAMIQMLGLPAMIQMLGLSAMIQMLGLLAMIQMLGLPAMIQMLGLPAMIHWQLREIVHGEVVHGEAGTELVLRVQPRCQQSAEKNSFIKKLPQFQTDATYQINAYLFTFKLHQ
jgi:hypothetical protein